MQRKRGCKIPDVETALFEIQAGHQIFNHTLCVPAGQLKGWTVSRLIDAVKRGVLYTSELVKLP